MTVLRHWRTTGILDTPEISNPGVQGRWRLLSRGGSDKEFRFLLFSDALVYGMATGLGKVKHHRTLGLQDTRLAEEPDGEVVRNGFQLINPQKSFVVMANTPAEKYEWLIAINESIEKASAEKEAAFKNAHATDGDTFAAVWQPDRLCHKCPLCDVAFSLLRRRHHVRCWREASISMGVAYTCSRHTCTFESR